MPQEVGPDDFLRMARNLRTANSVNRGRQQGKTAWTGLEEYRRRCGLFLLFLFLTPLFLYVVSVADDLFHKSCIFGTGPILERLESPAMLARMQLCYIVMAGWTQRRLVSIMLIGREWRTYQVTPIDPVSGSGTIDKVMHEMYISLSKS